MSNLIEKKCIKCNKPVMCEEDEIPYCAKCFKELQKRIKEQFGHSKRSTQEKTNAR